MCPLSRDEDGALAYYRRASNGSFHVFILMGGRWVVHDIVSMEVDAKRITRKMHRRLARARERNGP